MRYLVEAEEGETLRVIFNKTDPGIDYGILLPDGNNLLETVPHQLSYKGQVFENGEHVVVVRNDSGAEAHYALTIETY